ncbi:MAG: superoxide dismutase [Gemmatimonadetes bacterium]|nr:superoxide dismutase [Gemmatimonadota bacterium]
MAHPFELPDLGYEYDALEPHIDARTMEIHHTKHHQGYTSKLNAALEGHSKFHEHTAEQLLRGIHALPEDIRTAVRNNGGGYHNHALFWRVIAPGGSERPSGKLASAIDDAFGSFDAFQERFTNAASGRFGSGWGWLAVCPFGDLHVLDTANQDSPLMEGYTPILGVDVWEHAYYLKYQNRRGDYLGAIWNVVNWDEVDARFKKASEGWIHTV